MIDGATLRSRGLVFALAAGAIAFVLAVLATWSGHVDIANATAALIPAIVCALFCWAAAERAVAGTAAAIDSAIARLIDAADGDLASPIPADVGASVPLLSTTMASLFDQLSVNLADVERLAMYDSVTGLPNRAFFRRTCEQALAAMMPEMPGTLLFIDLDRFKAVNDTRGHAAGDMLLAQVAQRLRVAAESAAALYMSAAPLVGRLAGDEFTIFLPGLPDAAAGVVARDVLATLVRPFDIGGAQACVGASIGIANRASGTTTLTELMKAADVAMYHAKEQGRGRAEAFTPMLASALATRDRIDADLRSAIDAREFALVFQPQVSARDDQVVAAEALLRWRHPVEGVKHAASFIARAEDNGLIVEIGQWEVAEIARTIALWARRGATHRLGVNVGARQLDHAGFIAELRGAMREAGAPPALLELEIGETLAMHCSDSALASIAALRAEGARVAIDDFGTGYSNIARLRDLPIDRIKLDRSIVEHVAARREARTVAHAAIGLIHALGCEAVASGIERPAQAEVLRVIGCDTLQGHGIAEPMDGAVLLDWIDARRAQPQARAMMAP
ncbi:putative bifunctional diguanylate cyclase/phosphodiesterase [Sphingomonas sp.]|uniref:putative bifunctional diguanylate cyclase/phosphodiesterase n=1 Tax=Sphingomonas sp. TaxID=28214 RepID=UPI0035BC6E50